MSIIYESMKIFTIKLIIITLYNWEICCLLSLKIISWNKNSILVVQTTYYI